MNLAVYPRAAALLDGNLNVSVVLEGEDVKKLMKNKLQVGVNYKSLKPTDLSAVCKEDDGGVCGVDVNRLQLD